MFSSERINPRDLSEYSEYIPDNYILQVRGNSLYAGMVVDTVGGVDRTKVIYVTGHFAGWIELVWTYFMEEDSTPSAKADLLRYIFRAEQERIKDPLKGIFCEVHIQEVRDVQVLKRVLRLAGMETAVTGNNIYEFALSDVKEAAFLKKAAGRIKCTQLSEADDTLLSGLESLIRADDRPVPFNLVSGYSDYLQDVSFISHKGGKPDGAVLLYEKKDYIVIDCAYVDDPVALAGLLGNAYMALLDEYGPGQKILVPVVVNKTAEIVTHMVPDAQRGELIEGVLWL